MRAYGEKKGDAFNDGDLVRWKGGYVNQPPRIVRRLLKRRARREGRVAAQSYEPCKNGRAV